MSVVFALRGTSLDAYHSLGGKSPALSGSPVPALEASVISGAFGGSVINMDGALKKLSWPGRKNIAPAPNGAVTILKRILPTFSGTPGSNTGLMRWDASSGSDLLGWFINPDGSLFIYLVNAAAAILWNHTTPVKSDWVADQPTDLMISWDGSADANSVKVSIDGVEFDTFTPAGASGIDPSRIMILEAGIAFSGVQAPKFKLNELLIFDSAEAHVYAARTNFWPIDALDGLDNSDPGIANVRSGTIYLFGGASRSGSLQVPTAANVRAGVAVDAGTGSLDLPAVANVRAGTTFDGATKTGLLDLPAVANVRLGTAFDQATKTGLAAIPAAANVRLGTATDQVTGLLNIPALADVRAGTTYDNATKTGLLNLPVQADVRSGVSYDHATKTGTLVPTLNLISAGNIDENDIEEVEGADGIVITSGDTIPWRLKATDNAGVARDLTGAVLTLRAKKTGGGDVSITNCVVDPDQTTNKGRFVVTPTSEQSLQLLLGHKLPILVDVVQGSAEYTLRAKCFLAVLSDDTASTDSECAEA